MEVMVTSTEERVSEGEGTALRRFGADALTGLQISDLTQDHLLKDAWESFKGTAETFCRELHDMPEEQAEPTLDLQKIRVWRQQAQQLSAAIETLESIATDKAAKGAPVEPHPSI